MTRHERFDIPCVVPRYEVDTLGAPFKVVVLDCVTKKVDPETGKVLTNIPDLVGLINAVVRSRVSYPRKLSGPEIKFVRNALGIKATTLARSCEMTPEHLSRCEAGAKVMSPLSERIFRLTSYVASYFPNAEEFFSEVKEQREVSKDIENKVKQPSEMAKKFLQQFLTMKIESVYDLDEELCFEFSRVPDEPNNSDNPNDEKDSEWEPRQPQAACG